jgi:hypothetical protein
VTARRSRWSRPKKASVIPGAQNQKESVFQSKVGKYAVTKGALHYHTHNSERSEGGFPDSVIVGNYVMFRELKSDSDSARVSAEQRKWIEKLEAVGADVGVWWPIDWETGKVQAEIDACVKRRRADGTVVLPNLAKVLYLFTDERPAAGIHWDAGSRGIDRLLWQENAATLSKMIAHSLPRTDEEILAWLSTHQLDGSAGASAFFEALRNDLIANARGERNPE